MSSPWRKKAGGGDGLYVPCDGSYDGRTDGRVRESATGVGKKKEGPPSPLQNFLLGLSLFSAFLNDIIFFQFVFLE